MSCEDIADEYTPVALNGEPFDATKRILMNPPRFVGAALVPATTFVESNALSQGEPPLPSAFRHGSDDLPVLEIIATRRSTKNDRGDDYLAKHWYEFRTAGDRVAVVYFDRKARAGRPRWWLYSITE